MSDNTVENNFIWFIYFINRLLSNAYFPSAAHICIMNWVSIGAGKELSSIRHQDITWNIADLLSIAPY